MNFIEQAVARRTKNGLRLEWRIVGEPNFVAYPKDEAQKLAWLASGERQGWELVTG